MHRVRFLEDRAASDEADSGHHPHQDAGLRADVEPGLRRRQHVGATGQRDQREGAQAGAAIVLEALEAARQR